jgi:hypothetical protein
MIRFLAGLYLKADGTEFLIACIARRIDRVGDDPPGSTPEERLRHVVREWLNESQREALASWLARKIDRVGRLVPEGDPAPPSRAASQGGQ